MNEGMFNRLDSDSTESKKMTPFTLINCNARSLYPKIDSLIDCVHETEAAVGVVTETWLGSAEAEELTERLTYTEGLGMITKNRKEAANGVSYGGVAVIWDESRCTMKRLDYRAGDYEILACSGRIKGHSRHLVILACYIPPGYTKLQGEGALEEVSEMIVDLKRRFSDPYLVVAGDFNQWDIGEVLLDFQDIREAAVGGTRNGKKIDRIFTNMTRSIEKAGTLAPLESDDSTKKSDHRTAFCTFQMQKMKTFKWEKFTYRHYNEASVELFKNWVVFHEWKDVLQAEGSNQKAEAYQRTLTAALDRFFPKKTTRRRTDKHPWMNKRTEKLIQDRKDLYWEEGGRTEVWKERKREAARVILERKRGFLDTQKGHLLEKDANRNFFRNVKSFCRFEKPELFDVRSLFTNKSDNEVGESLADFFNKV